MPEPKCPLCFRVLTEQDTLLRFCPNEHPGDDYPRAVRFSCTPHNLFSPDEDLLRCGQPECHGVEGTDTDVFLLHVGCSMKNPFWDAAAGAVAVPQSISVQAAGGRAFIVQHGGITVLQKAQGYEGELEERTRGGSERKRVSLKERPEMWFPAELLRATFAADRDGRATGLFVKLCGARGVGKSILATMALFNRNYPQIRGVNHYVYLPPKDGAQFPYIDFATVLLPLALLTRRSVAAADLVLPTPPTWLNLKVLFLSDKLETGAPAPAEERPAQSAWANFVRWYRHVFLSLQAGQYGPAGAGDPVFTVAFYDAAGELFEAAGTELVQRLDQHADVAAVLVNSLDLVCCRGFRPLGDSQDAGSVSAAVNELARFARREARRCIVVTQLDEVCGGALQRRLGLIADKVAVPDKLRQLAARLPEAAGKRELEELAADIGRCFPEPAFEAELRRVVDAVPARVVVTGTQTSEAQAGVLAEQIDDLAAKAGGTLTDSAVLGRIAAVYPKISDPTAGAELQEVKDRFKEGDHSIGQQLQAIANKLPLAFELNRQLARFANGAAATDQRDVLAQWLSHEGPRVAAQQEENNLARLLRDIGTVNRVFFIWTENLGSAQQIPASKGLLNFVRWCRAGAPHEAPPAGAPAAASGD